VQSPLLFSHVSRARCVSTAIALAPTLPALSSRFAKLSSACASSSVMSVAASISGIASVFEQRFLAGRAEDCPQWLQPSPSASLSALAVDLVQPLLQVPDAASTSSAACALLRCCR
jgi:hypothetical protein